MSSPVTASQSEPLPAARRDSGGETTSRRSEDDEGEKRRSLFSSSKTFNVLALVFLATEMLLGTVLFAVEVHYDVAVDLFGRYYVNHRRERFVRSYLVRCRLIHAVTTAFPLVIIPVIALTTFVTRRIGSVSTMWLLFTVTAFVCYLSCGVVSLATTGKDDTAVVSTSLYSGIAFLLCVVYVAHFGSEIMRNRRGLVGRRKCSSDVSTAAATAYRSSSSASKKKSQLHDE